MASHDFVYDLLNKLELQKINYYLVTIDNKQKTKDIKTFTSLESNDDIKKLLSLLLKDKKKN